MPKYFTSKAKMLHAEAYASFLLIQDALVKSFDYADCSYPDRMIKIFDKANARVYRRSIMAFRSK